jgi:hypothetical protein
MHFRPSWSVAPTRSEQVARERDLPGSVYLGVASEQNFTYIDVMRPKVAFIFDVRRQNTLLLLMYKALFEKADNRADFVSLLFSRKRPAGLDANSSVDALSGLADAKPDAQLTPPLLRTSRIV